MDSSRTSFELLAHFDAPDVDQVSRPSIEPTVGVICVLKWVAAAGVLFVAACTLLRLGCCIAAERSLSHAARAGVLEATLPRATRESVIATIERRLLHRSMSSDALQITIQQNGAPMQRVFQLADQDRVSVALSLPTCAVLPAWLRAVYFWTGDSPLQARAEQRIPGREFRTAAHTQTAAE
jgi:hypothetical protein